MAWAYNGTVPRISFRTADLSATAWGQWYEVYHEGNKPTLADLGAAASSHTHTIANVTNLQATLDGKALASHTHASSAITGLGEYDSVATTITDWNTAKNNGIYMGNGAANGPTATWYMGYVMKHNDTYTIQVVTAFSTTHKWYRRYQNGGTWSPWEELYNFDGNYNSLTNKPAFTSSVFIASAASKGTNAGDINLTITGYTHTVGNTINFKAPDIPASTNTIIINGSVKYDLATYGKQLNLTGGWAKDAMLSVVASDVVVTGRTNKTAFMSFGGSGDSVEGPVGAPDDWIFFQAYTTNSVFTVPETGWYRIHVFGASGKGGDGVSFTPVERNGAGGSGGGSGGYSCSILNLSVNSQINITTSNTISSFGDYISCTAGSPGIFTFPANVNGVGGIGGNASGGNVVNLYGSKGGDGGAGNKTAGQLQDESIYYGKQGGNQGAFGGISFISGQNRTGGGGGGGAYGKHECNKRYLGDIQAFSGGNGRSVGSNTNEPNYPTMNLNNPILFGGGNGGGGNHVSVLYISYGSLGSPGIVIIEKGYYPKGQIDSKTLLLLDMEDFKDKSPYGVTIKTNNCTLTNTGKFGKGLNPSGGSLNFDTLKDPDFLNKDFTIDWWENRSTTTNGDASFSLGDANTLMVGHNINGKYQVYLAKSTDTNAWTEIAGLVCGDMLLNQWVHRAVVRNGNNLLFFQNGKIFVTTTIKSILKQVNVTSRIGTNTTPSMNGSIDEFRISSVARWITEFTPPTKPYSE